MTLIGLCGYAQSGKDTVASILCDERGFERIAFADTMRAFALAVNPIVVGASRLSAVVEAYGWDAAKTQFPEVRALLQRIGTEGGRNILGENIWVDAAMARAGEGNVVLTDVRFPNEAFAAKNRGQLWRVVREGYGPVNAHESETAIDHIVPDVVIRNDSSIDDLRAEVLERLNSTHRGPSRDATRALARAERLRVDL